MNLMRVGDRYFNLNLMFEAEIELGKDGETTVILRFLPIPRAKDRSFQPHWIRLVGAEAATAQEVLHRLNLEGGGS